MRFFLLLFLFFPLFAVSGEIPNGALEGAILHKQILEKYPLIDKYYYSPTLDGAVSQNPIISIGLPAGEWARLSADQREKLKSFASLATRYARREPLKYSNVPETAPIASKIINNAKLITATSWRIYEGRISADGRDILVDRTVAKGK